MAIAPGTTLGPYQVTAKIAEGGMGQMYLARDTKLDRDVALKVLPDLFVSDPEWLARFTARSPSPRLAESPQYRQHLLSRDFVNLTIPTDYFVFVLRIASPGPAIGLAGP